MGNYDIYADISRRTNGEIYIGVVGPVRTGKSTFIKRVIETMVIPHVEEGYPREHLMDELPQSGSGKMIMTMQPHFVPGRAVKVGFGENVSAMVRLLDSVGYLVDGAIGHMDGEVPRMVRTPWMDEEISFEEAAEMGTRRIITDHSTIGLVITTDGSITDIPRENYIDAENRAIGELKELGKPFAVVVNSVHPNDSDTVELARTLADEHGVPVIPCDILSLDESGIIMILESILYSFPIKELRLNIPQWMLALSNEHWLIKDMTERLVKAADMVSNMNDSGKAAAVFENCSHLEKIEVSDVSLSDGRITLMIHPAKDLFYKIIGDECGYEIQSEYHLISMLKDLVKAKKEYDNISEALDSVRMTGYGMVKPQQEELELEEPQIVRQGNRYGVKLKASAPSLHILRVDIETEVSPIVGTEKQSEELLDYLISEFEGNPAGIWDTNIFGKSLNDLVKEGLSNKLTRMPEDIQTKMQLTLQRVINEGKNNMLCLVF